MRTLLLFVVFLVNSLLFGQDIELSGTLEGLYINQGGVEQEFSPQPYPLTNFTLIVVSLKDSLSKPKVVAEMTSDSLGNFSLFLPPGNYGFIDKNDDLKKGQFTPENQYEGDEQISHSVVWECNFSEPIALAKFAVTEIHLLRIERHICHGCP